MKQITYQVPLAVDGRHAVSVQSEDPAAVTEGLVWAQDTPQQPPANPNKQEAPPDATRAADRGMLVIRLAGFEEIRTTAGHLVARRTVTAAKQAIAGVLRGEDRVVQLGEDTLAVLLTDTSAVPHICRRIEGCLERVEVPARAHKLTAEFSEVTGEATGAQAA